MRKISPLLLVFTIFIFLSLYLHQKIQIYAAAFNLQKNYNNYQELAAKKDYLMQSYLKKVSLSQVSSWVSAQNFSSPGKEKLLVFKPRDNRETNTVAKKSFLGRIRSSASIADVFAKER
ncbi:MAG: hypothetical protein K9L87_03905 [Candidatus Omnitrophica bacterium]|nr:hypothetical protein [Candidatus Omnitrophota bacterium]MCF7891700.1 hypothetical protein [Candidatus Omnitrophota bacterium]MCF7895604.1 hypothetical protein [Candidatus Omnitrophota bacterium]MCF7897876.1 hypothetical protein [Candidatus Omnitrophota bacterium]MCF7909120.1 hypothetical protein [Candidatus Omnitrophota bacterium]